MTLRQCQILEALLTVEESRDGGNVGFGAHPDEVKAELRGIRPYRHSSELVRRELRELAPKYVRERRAKRGRAHFTLTVDGRAKARELAESRARLRREAQERGRRNREARR